MYDHKKIEAKWQKYWEKHPKLYQADDKSQSKKMYVLDMFPYPSGEGLHAGHVESYTATDIISRYFSMRGKNVLHPQGWDAFGLPAENYAIKTKIHPAITTKKAIKTFKEQMKMMGFSYDWSREIASADPDYYQWTQWFFLLLYKNGLAYKAKGKVNWCDSCQTVLANEQAESGVCERCGSTVRQKDLEQWYFKITDFIENNGKTSGLLEGLDKIDWPESTKAGQRNWIGKSAGAEIELRITNYELRIKVFTTRLDTIFGCTFALIAPEHKLVQQLKPQIANWPEVEKYINEAKKKTELQRLAETKEKTGVQLKGIKVINPFTKKEIPLFASDFVLAHYGTGAVMAVPGHDQRDYDFAKKFGLPIENVIKPVKQNCIIIHGSPQRDKSHEPDYIPENQHHWLPWLKKSLERIGIQTFTPQMPESWQPIYADWKKEFEKLEINEDSILIGHSAGGAFLARWLSETGKRVNKLILVAAGKKLVDSNQRLVDLYDFKLNKNIKNQVNSLVIFVADNEEEYKRQNAFEYQKELAGELIELKGMGHFTLGDMGKKELPELIEKILESKNAYTEDGILINSGGYNRLTSQRAREKLAEWLEKEKIGQRTVNYKIRDWLVSRQRYWGAPIPIIYCSYCHSRPTKCGGNPEISGSRVKPGMTEYNTTVIDGKEYAMIPVPEKDLPVKLPTDVDFVPHGESPLARSKKFQKVKCPVCGGPARREADTMDTFVCSSWYYFRYSDPKNKKEFAAKEKIKKWLPVDLYVGGAEHTVLHLLYSRFFTKVLHKLGYIDFDEPFVKLRHQGIILAEDGRKMSKSLGNIINPDSVVADYGADALRMLEMFMGPLADAKPWNTKGIIGLYRFIEKIYRLKSKVRRQDGVVKSQKLEQLLHKTIKKVGEDIEALKFNTAISALMILANALEKEKEISIIHYSLFIILLSPFAPHLAEELWSQLTPLLVPSDAGIKGAGGFQSIFKQPWPEYDPELIKDKMINLTVQVNSKVRDNIAVAAGLDEAEAKKIALESEKVKKWIEEKEVIKVIFVKGKLVNIVVKG